MNTAFKLRSDGMWFIAFNKTPSTNLHGADMLIVFIILAILAALCLATIAEVLRERLQENTMVTLVTEKTLKL